MVSTIGKRDIEHVDLTDDDDRHVRAQKASRIAHAQPVVSLNEEVQVVPSFQSSQSFAQIAQEEEDGEAANLVQGSQDIDYTNAYMLYGRMPTKTVGVRFYNGQATIGERVLLVREPNNPYDRNAIQVKNVMGDQVGHVGRNVAAKLAPYMDSRDLLVEGMLTGIKGAYDCPMSLSLFGTSDISKRQELQQRMERDKLPVNEVKKTQREEDRQRRKQLQQELKNKGRPGESMDILVSQSTIFNPRDVNKVVEEFGLNESDLANMPMAESPAALATELLHYQRQGLAWMISKESPTLPPSGSDAVEQLWKRKGNYFMNIATNYTTSTAPPLASGGILADDMGLGKTIQIISLILANSQPKTPESSASTLIISPVGVMSNWKNQIELHTKKEHAPRVLVYHGPGKKEAGNFSDYDVVITSYGALAMEYNVRCKLPPKRGIFSVHWRRVVLDEGHTIRNPRSKGALAACNLRSGSRWTLTGTPIINSLKDLYSQVRFLRLSGGLEDMAVFNSTLIRPLSREDPDARLLLQALMATICLRRRKDMNFINLRLPPLTSRVFRIKFYAHEEEKYDMFLSEARGALSNFKAKEQTKESTYSHILEVILRLRQVCNHWTLCKNRVDKLASLLDKHKIVPLTSENIKALQNMLQVRIESQETCAICLGILEQPVITACGHAFDRGCIEQVIERQHKCPMCRAEIKDMSTLVSPAAELGESAESAVGDPDDPSSKIEALIKILTAQGQPPDTKSVVFSQWTSFLDVVEPHLRANGIEFARIDGKMNSIKRDQSIHIFSNDPNCKVLLASLSVCSVGLNLVAANQAILADSWWAPAIEDQAVDRVYRLGQTRETTVWRLIIEESIEDRVLDRQEEKRKLMLDAFRETAKKKKGEDRAARIAELEQLLA